MPSPELLSVKEIAARLGFTYQQTLGRIAKRHLVSRHRRPRSGNGRGGTEQLFDFDAVAPVILAPPPKAAKKGKPADVEPEADGRRGWPTRTVPFGGAGIPLTEADMEFLDRQRERLAERRKGVPRAR